MKPNRIEQKRVIVVGNVGLDTNVFLNREKLVEELEGSFSENLDYIGHSSAFASRGFARLGMETAFIGPVGDDFIGEHIRRTLAGDGIDLSGLWVDPAGSDRSVNIILKDGRRKGFFHGKGHLSQRADPATAQKVMAGAALAHFSLPDWARYLLPVAKDAGLLISCDLQDVTDPHDVYRQDFADAADILFFSAANRPDPTPLMEHYLTNRPERIVLSGMGAEGVALGTADGIRFFPPVPMDAPVVDTSGAGDSLAVGFLTSYVGQGRPLEESVMRGQIAARHCCTLKASSDGLITAAEIDTQYATLACSPRT